MPPFYQNKPQERAAFPSDPGGSVIDPLRLLTGDRAAWDGFVAWSLPHIKSAVRHTLALHTDGSGHDPDDVIQNVYLRLIKDNYRLLRQFDPGRATLKTWLVVIARSTTLNCLNQSPPAHVPLEEVSESELSRQPGDGPREPLRIPPGVLSRCEQAVIDGHYCKGLPLEEVAYQLQVSLKTVYNCKSKALAKLRARFGRA